MPGAEAETTRRALRQGAYLREDIARAWAGLDPLETAFALQGEVYRDVPGRRTLQVGIGASTYFVKLHYGVGWGEIVKNWLQFKIPVVGAENEFAACRGLQQAGISAPVAAAYGRGPGSPAARNSYVLCDELRDHTSLEDVTDPWPLQPPHKLERLRLLTAVALFARRFHAAGYIHRDFYLCHLLAPAALLRAAAADQPVRASELPPLAVLDLHRARRFDDIPDRWLKRDLAGLLFSALDLGYSQADWLRFIRIYSGRPLRQELQSRGAFWRSVYRRARGLYVKGQRKGLVKGLYKL